MPSAFISRQGFLALAALLLPALASAQTSAVPVFTYGPTTPAMLAVPAAPLPYSSSLIASREPEETMADIFASRPAVVTNTESRTAAYFGGYQAESGTGVRRVHAFSDMAAQLKFGSGGIGFDLATPLSQHLNLRGGGTFFSYQTSLIEDGLHIDGNLSFANAALSVDYFPFHSGFRISPGVTFYNDTTLQANLSVPGGQSFSFGDYNATSDPLDPIRGAAAIHFGHMVSPRLTAGWGNMIPRKGNQRWSVPFEVGVQFASRPKIHFNVSGQGCSSQTEPDGSVDYGCGPVDQTFIVQEQEELQQDINGLRFFPVLSIGLSYRFGLGGR